MVVITSEVQNSKNLRVIGSELLQVLKVYQGGFFEIKSQSVLEGKLFKVGISGKTIGELLYSGGHQKYTCLCQIKEIVENGVFERKEQPKKDNKNQIATWWFKTIVLVGGNKFEFFFSVKEFVNEDRKLYSGHIDIEKPLQ